MSTGDKLWADKIICRAGAGGRPGHGGGWAGGGGEQNWERKTNVARKMI